MKAFTLGKYVPYNSWVHRLDPRIKIAAVIFLMVAVFFPMKTYAMTFAFEGAMFLIVALLLASTRTPFTSVLSSLKSMWLMILFLLLIYILVPKTNHVLPEAWNLNGWIVYWDSFAEAGKIFLRLFMMIMITMALTSSTKPLDLTYALEWYLTPLKVVHFPAAEVAMTISIALRFIPTLLEDASRVMKAQASRGVDMAHGRLFSKIRGLTSLIIPLFVSAFMRSEELANAMECRGYDPKKKRTRYRKLKFNPLHLIPLFVSAAILAGTIVMSVMGIDLFALAGVIAL